MVVLGLVVLVVQPVMQELQGGTTGCAGDTEGCCGAGCPPLAIILYILL